MKPYTEITFRGNCQTCLGSGRVEKRDRTGVYTYARVICHDCGGTGRRFSRPGDASDRRPERYASAPVIHLAQRGPMRLLDVIADEERDDYEQIDWTRTLAWLGVFIVAMTLAVALVHRFAPWIDGAPYVQISSTTTTKGER